jgi:hypothetical protein
MTARQGRRRGRPLLLAVRAPDSAAYGRAVGLDVPRWLEEGLVDVVIAGGDQRFEPWENVVTLARAYDRPVYACLAGDYLPQEGADWPLHWRGHALRAWEAGVNGIYTFNFLQHRHSLLREMGDPDLLRRSETRYAFTAGTAWGFLANEKDYVHAVRIEPSSGPFAKPFEARLSFIAEPSHKIRYTLDGGEPTRQSSLYRDAIPIHDTAIVQARSYAVAGTATPVVRAEYWKVDAVVAARPGSLPLDFFGLGHGSRRSVLLEVESTPGTSRGYLYLEMTDVDAPRESLLFVNGHGPLEPPPSVISGSQRKSGVLLLPESYLQEGDNEVMFVFDNLNGGTSGFIVDEVKLVLHGGPLPVLSGMAGP